MPWAGWDPQTPPSLKAILAWHAEFDAATEQRLSTLASSRAEALSAGNLAAVNCIDERRTLVRALRRVTSERLLIPAPLSSQARRTHELMFLQIAWAKVREASEPGNC